MPSSEANAVPVSAVRATYVRAADLFRQVLGELRAEDLARPVPTCPGWSVSDVITHVHDNHLQALGPDRSEADDVMAAYALAIPEAPDLTASAPFDTMDLTLHAWDVALACGVELRLADDQLAFLEAFAAAAGDRLYVEDGFARLEGELADPGGLDRQAAALLPFGRRL